MREDDVILTPIPQADGQVKNRPAVVLRAMPPFQALLVWGISTQLQQVVQGFDDVIRFADDDFKASGLLADSLIRLGCLAVLPRRTIVGSIGSISAQRHQRLLSNLSAHLTANLSPNG
jgi:mRNA interferase MazF